MTELTPELLADWLIPGEPQFSPNGQLLAFTVTAQGRREEHPQSAIWLATVDQRRQPYQLTAGKANDTSPRWSPDGQTLYFLSDRVQRGEAQLYQLAIAGGEAIALTSWGGGIAAFAPLADGQTIALLACDSPTSDDDRRKNERDDAQVWGERWRLQRLRLLDLQTTTVRTVEALGERHIQTIAPAPNGQQLALLSWPNPEIDNAAFPTPLLLVDLPDGTVRELCTLPLSTNHLAWTADGSQLAYIAQAVAGGVSGNGLFVVTVADGARRQVVADLPACPLNLTQHGTSDILVTVAEGLDTTLQRLDPQAGTLTELCRMPGELGAPTVSTDGQLIAGVRSLPDSPPDLWAGPVSGPLVRLTDLQPALREMAWGEQERLAWQGNDGLALDGLLILPPGKTRADGPFPTVVLVHGGPYSRFADDFQLSSGRPSGQWLAAGGYAVFLPNARGGVGHGNDFALSVAGRVGLEDWEDILAGLDLLIEAGVADPERLGIGGWSQGGFMTAWAVGQTERFRCGVMGAGVSDWGMMVAQSDLPTFEAGLGGSTGWEGIGPHQHDRVSPISFVHRVKTPVLILHGERDERVPVSQAQFFARGLRHYGVPNDLVIYPREPHGLKERAHQIDASRRLRAWFDRWLLDR